MFAGFTRHHYQIGLGDIELILSRHDAISEHASRKLESVGFELGREKIIEITPHVRDGYIDIYTIRLPENVTITHNINVVDGK